MKLLLQFFITTSWLYLFSNPANGQHTNSSNLSAVLIVGPQQSGTREAIQKMDDIGNLFSNYGVRVFKFYDNNADWNQITEVAKECNFLVYSGHGSTLGENGNVGGICINTMISSATLMRTLRLKENALVIFKSVCNGAGSSAGDDIDIGISEAKKRVTYYAYPFFETGAVAYYANNFGNGVNKFLDDFLSGTTLRQAYLNSTKIWTEIEIEEPFSRDNNKTLSIASSPGGGTATRTTYINGVKHVKQVISQKGYEIAFVGNPYFSIRNMNE